MLLYSLKPNIKRIIIPKIVKLLALCIVFYLGIWVNLLLLDLELSGYIKILIAAILVVLFAMEPILSYSKASKISYNFFDDRISLEGKKQQSILYRDVTDMALRQNFTDKPFNTYSLMLEPDFRISFINNGSQVYVYLQKLVQRARLLRR